MIPMCTSAQDPGIKVRREKNRKECCFSHTSIGEKKKARVRGRDIALHRYEITWKT